MTIHWPQSTRTRFGKDIIQTEHVLDQSPLFSDAALADLLDAYPRDQLGIWTFADHAEGEEAPVRGQAPGLSGKDLLEAVQRGRIWLNLRAANRHVADYEGVAETIFDSLQDASGQKVRKRDMSVLISSPNIHVHYHLDIPLVALLQIRGEKKVWFYPPTGEFAPDERLEAIVLREQEEGLRFSTAFESSARCVYMMPGAAVTWPQTAPHRVQNGDMMNVSLSCEFMTLPALIKANALYTNGRLRRTFGARPRRPQRLSPAVMGKAALARLMKQADRRGTTAQGPTAPSFEVDLNAAGCTRTIG